MELGHQYDYIIVGGGTAGCVVAARLAENPHMTVCLIEAGPTDHEKAEVLAIKNWPNLLGTELRVADASIFPTMISVNPCITCMMIGEKCAALLT